jgi:hypothetical protein
MEWLVKLRSFPEYSGIQDRLVDPEPADAWQEEGLHYFTFELSQNGVRSPENDPPVAVFTIDDGSGKMVSAVIVTPLPDGKQARIDDLRSDEAGYNALLPGRD